MGSTISSGAAPPDFLSGEKTAKWSTRPILQLSRRPRCGLVGPKSAVFGLCVVKSRDSGVLGVHRLFRNAVQRL